MTSFMETFSRPLASDHITLRPVPSRQAHLSGQRWLQLFGTSSPPHGRCLPEVSGASVEIARFIHTTSRLQQLCSLQSCNLLVYSFLSEVSSENSSQPLYSQWKHAMPEWHTSPRGDISEKNNSCPVLWTTAMKFLHLKPVLRCEFLMRSLYNPKRRM